MYVKQEFQETRREVLHQLIHDYPLATVITHTKTDGLDANHIPFFLNELGGPDGVLQGHIARSNPLCNLLARGEVDILAIFHGPQAYITPSWYAGKAIHGKVVPTWNYAVVHVYGTARLMDDAVWLHTQLQALTTENERSLPTPWQVNDAPGDFIEKMARAIVGIEVSVDRCLGKWKVSQNQSRMNQIGVVSGLQSEPHPNDRMANLVAAVIKPD